MPTTPVEDPGPTFVYELTSGDWYERHAAAAPSATQIDNSLTGRPIVMPTNRDSASARTELTIYSRSPSSGSATSNGHESLIGATPRQVATGMHCRRTDSPQKCPAPLADAADAFGDDMTVYPDHAVARVAAAAVVATLVERERTGLGRQISVCQMETVFMQLSTAFLRESIEPDTMIARGGIPEFDAPGGVFECTGDDAYCTVTVDGDDDWQRLAAAIERPDLADDPRYGTATGRVAHRAVLDDALARWTRALTPREVAERLQSAGIAAGAAVHVGDLAEDPHLRFRHQFGVLPQPGRPQLLFTETGPALFENIPAPALEPAPLVGAHTVEICRELLGLDDEAISALAADGVLETNPSPAPGITSPPQSSTVGRS